MVPIAGEIGCAAIRVVHQAVELGAARDQRDAVCVQPQVVRLRIGEGEEAVAACDDADVDIGHLAQPYDALGLLECAQQFDGGGVQEVLGPLLRFVQQRPRRMDAHGIEIHPRESAGIAERDRTHPRGPFPNCTADHPAEQHDFLQDAVEQQPVERDQRDLPEAAQQKVAQLRGVGDLKQFGGQHQTTRPRREPAVCSRRRTGPTRWSTGGVQAGTPHQLQRRVPLIGCPVAEADVGAVPGNTVPVAAHSRVPVCPAR